MICVCGKRFCASKIDEHLQLCKIAIALANGKIPNEMCCPSPKLWPMLQPYLDTCEKVKYVRVECNYVKKEANNNMKTTKTNTTPEKPTKAAAVSASTESPAREITARRKRVVVVVPASIASPTGGVTTRTRTRAAVSTESAASTTQKRKRGRGRAKG